MYVEGWGCQSKFKCLPLWQRFGRHMGGSWWGSKKLGGVLTRTKRPNLYYLTVYLDIGWKGRISIVILLLKQERHIGRNSGAPKEEAIK